MVPIESRLVVVVVFYAILDMVLARNCRKAVCATLTAWSGQFRKVNLNKASVFKVTKVASQKIVYDWYNFRFGKY